MAKKIMLQTKDKTFFVHKKSLPLLVEFAKTFKAKLAVVEVKSATITELENLASEFCDQNSEEQELPNYSVLQTLYPTEKSNQAGKTKTREEVLQNAQNIKKYIRNKIEQKGTLSLKELKQHFASLNVTDSCLSNHFSSVRRELKKEGYMFNSIGKGAYTTV